MSADGKPHRWYSPRRAIGRLVFALVAAAGAFAIGWGETFAIAGCIIALSAVAYFWRVRAN
jgi:hypothetical protein